jgi:20S proteasome subunit alpha 6
VEYAQEAVKQGSVVVGLVNKTHCVLVGLKVRSSHSNPASQA